MPKDKVLASEWYRDSRFSSSQELSEWLGKETHSSSDGGAIAAAADILVEPDRQKFTEISIDEKSK